MNKEIFKLLIFNRMTPETMQVKENAMYSLREARQNHLAKVEYEKEKKKNKWKIEGKQKKKRSEKWP